MNNDETVIARVLCSAHHTAQTHNAPDEERAILHVAQSLADELVTRDPQFDRLEFIEVATEQQSAQLQ